MPYYISMEHPDCKGGHAVIKEENDELITCHETHEDAEKHLTALNIAMAEEEKSVDQDLETRQVDLTAPASKEIVYTVTSECTTVRALLMMRLVPLMVT